MKIGRILTGEEVIEGERVMSIRNRIEKSISDHNGIVSLLFDAQSLILSTL